MRPLVLWDVYSRQEVHAILAPDTTFTHQTGTWGLQGIVPIPNRPGSFVFFVTYGKSQGAHEFDESITPDGVLTWQSQPRHRLADSTIRTFIDHDDRQETIHLFLRTQPRRPYYYCGALGYLSHDTSRERPVHFQWQLMDWPPPRAISAELGVDVVARAVEPGAVASSHGALTLASPPPPMTRGGRGTREFLAQRRPWYPDQDAANAALGLAGEKLVVAMERQRLRDEGRADLAEMVSHTSVVEGDGAGYDIRSYDQDGVARFVEVKTTRGGATAAFFISPNEIAFSQAHPDVYVLIRVFGYDNATDSGRYYEVRGPIGAAFDLTPTQFRAAYTG